MKSVNISRFLRITPYCVSIEFRAALNEQMTEKVKCRAWDMTNIIERANPRFHTDAVNKMRNQARL